MRSHSSRNRTRARRALVTMLLIAFAMALVAPSPPASAFESDRLRADHEARVPLRVVDGASLFATLGEVLVTPGIPRAPRVAPPGPLCVARGPGATTIAAA